MRRVLASLCVLFGVASSAPASVIIAPVAGTIDVGGPGFGTLTETFNQAGLSVGYTAGVTDFNTYIGTNPQHTEVFSGFEWFSNSGTTGAQVTYDLGSVQTIDALALWNEESSGIGTLDLYGSTDGVNFSALALGLTPFDNPLTLGSGAGTYGPEVFTFAATSVQFVRFVISDSPQPDPGSFPAAAIGEVAFRVGELQQVPEPMTLAVFGGVLALGGCYVRRRKSAAV